MTETALRTTVSATANTPGGSEPAPADGFEVLLITGMSGAGRSHAADSVEDMGWYVVDNIPPKLLVPLVDMMTQGGGRSGTGVHKLAAVIDVRSREYFDDLSAVLSHLDDLGVKTRILFLDASNDVLIKRYESVRRPHPLQHGNRLIDGIKEERALLMNLKERADVVIDTSALSIHQLSTKLYEALLGSGPKTVAVHIFSFGFKYGVPLDADFVADVRFLPNPFWVPSLRELTGQDKPVSDYVLGSEGAGEFLDAYEQAILVALKGYAQEDKHFVTIAIGCTGGQHRSVAMSEALAVRLRAHGLTVSVSARELQRRHGDR
ncbi:MULTISPECIES: RNase adapter RapZ [Bifidobacterium]|uniref:RNase adapter RapZ n=1 Tax=Bifidobacterium TaxID=1678 RepID=UPI001BDD9B0A|nr:MULTISPECIES: RNase adapter RapZ [Bifidobacterium]MBT1162519.1 RNase adapter RapZ [Bifidobacterium sp. SO1]MBW3079345.1 RNase adapter RapZ [Bifidobacterium simiiventris]